MKLYIIMRNISNIAIIVINLQSIKMEKNIISKILLKLNYSTIFVLYFKCYLIITIYIIRK